MMRKFFFILILLAMNILSAQSTPADYWKGLSQDEKVAFVNGAYGTLSAIKSHHQQEVKKQYNQQLGWVEPYYIERFYEILDEHISQNAGYNLIIITRHMDSLYEGYDNVNIPLIEALRIVSLAQDEDHEKANLLLLKAQRKYSRFPSE